MSYSNFLIIKQKEAAYNRQQADSLEDVLDILEKARKQNTYFRGQENGAWKITSSLQREWFLKKLDRYFGSNYQELIQKFLAFAKEKHTSCLQKYDAKLTDCGVFSVLQHYGAPTPFVDWTSDYNVALYFASNFSTDNNNKSTNDLASSYISIYWIKVENNDEITNPDSNLSDLGEALDTISNFCDESGVDDNIAKEIIDNVQAECNWGHLHWFVSNKFPSYINIKNPRQEKQKGVFFYSSEYEKTLDEIFDDKDFSKIHCLDIPKALVPEIQEHVKNLNINDETLGLNSCNIGKMLFGYFLEHNHYV